MKTIGNNFIINKINNKLNVTLFHNERSMFFSYLILNINNFVNSLCNFIDNFRKKEISFCLISINTQIMFQN